MFLSSSQVQLLTPIASAIQHRDLTSIDQICQQAGGSFAYLYAGVLLAADQRIELALEKLKICLDHPFAKALIQYLEKQHQFTSPVRTFADTRPYDVWVKTDYYQTYQKKAKTSFGRFVREYFMHLDQKKTYAVIDVGVGNGVFINGIINQLAEITGLNHISLIAIEASAAMLQATSQYLESHCQINVDVIPVNQYIQDVPLDHYANYISQSELLFTMASASIHHVPEHQKLALIRKWHSFSDHVLIFESQGNHDIPAAGSPEFVYSVAEFYGFFIEDMTRSEAPEMDRTLCIEHLALAEAITMLSNPKEKRGDYHTSLAHWQSIAVDAGYHVHHIDSLVEQNQNILTFMMELQQ